MSSAGREGIYRRQAVRKEGQQSIISDSAHDSEGNRRRNGICRNQVVRYCPSNHLCVFAIGVTVVAILATGWCLWDLAFSSASPRKEGKIVTGLWTTHSKQFTAPPHNVSRTACVTRSQKVVIRSFRERGWKVLPELKPTYPCSRGQSASIIWSHAGPPSYLVQKPWQRTTRFPMQHMLNTKTLLAESLKKYAQRYGRENVSFLPETYTLPTDRDAVLSRFKEENGLSQPWVIKLSDVDSGIGIAVLGPNSSKLHRLADLVEDLPKNAAEAMNTIRYELIVDQEHDKRNPTRLAHETQRMAKEKMSVVVQKYVTNTLLYQGRKFDLRIYFLVASADPMLVYYHDGSLRVSMNQYKDDNFTSTADHLTNIGDNKAIEDVTVSFDDWDVELRQYVSDNPGVFPASIVRDPLQHIRQQIMAAIADLIASVHYSVFVDGRSSKYTRMENGFTLMGGDFMIDKQLNIWITEAQSSPRLSDSTTVKQKLNRELVPSTISIIEQVMAKQEAGEPLLPMQDLGGFQLVYTDDFHSKYDNPMRPF
jgi:hypothetical protein